MKTVLILLHDYPPIRTAGTERVIKFAQYLPEFGYQPLILTTGRYGSLPDDESAGVFRASDLVHTLFSPLRRAKSNALPPEEQAQVATFANRSRLGRLRDGIMTPDTKLGWLLPASRLGRAIIAARRPHLLFSSSPPETAHLIAHSLHRASGLPWLADLRDGWLFEPPNPAPRQQPWRQRLEAALERRVITQAAAVVTATAPITADLQERYPTAAGRIHTITNGFDEAEFAGLQRQRPPDGRVLLTYTGSLSASRAGTTAEPFFRALALHLAAHPATPLRLRLVGNIRPEEKALLHTWQLDAVVETLPPVSRREAHQHQLDADALLLITAPGQHSVATLKLFEYIRAGVPILALAHENAAAAIIHRDNLGLLAPPDDPAAIARSLDELVTRLQAGEGWPGVHQRAAVQQRYDRRSLTAQLAKLFDTL